ncbi:organic cation/carnitine transporter 7 [Tanacetum coccineum]
MPSPIRPMDDVYPPERPMLSHPKRSMPCPLKNLMPFANIYAPEIYPTTVRATGVGVASSVGRVEGMICPLVAIYLVDGCHQMIVIVLFEILIILLGLCVMFFPHETMARELADTVFVPDSA